MRRWDTEQEQDEMSALLQAHTSEVLATIVTHGYWKKFKITKSRKI